MASYLSNIFGCFSESSSESKGYICDGNVCVLSKPKEKSGKISSSTNKRKQSLRISFSCLSAKWCSHHCSQYKAHASASHQQAPGSGTC
ncbi:hypothetical protein CR513_11855, partial [Mucuna pruriens]